MKNKIIAFIITTIALYATSISCMSLNNTTGNATSPGTTSQIPQNTDDNISLEKTHLNLKIFQTLGKHQALAWTTHYDIVKIITLDNIYYDGKQIKGDFILVDTYTYETTQGIVKTVPVYVLTSEYDLIKVILHR